MMLLLLLLRMFREWRDHVQAGVCPTSRRGHTATLVLGRRTVDTAQQQDQGSSENFAGAAVPGAAAGLDPNTSNDSGEARSQTRGGEAESGNFNSGGGGNGNVSPRPPGKAAPEQQALQQGSERRRSSPGKGGRGVCGVGGRTGDGIGTGEGEGGNKQCESREMFVIGGAGTDPIRVRTTAAVRLALSNPPPPPLCLVIRGKLMLILLVHVVRDRSPACAPLEAKRFDTKQSSKKTTASPK